MPSSWYFQSPNALLTMIGHPLRCNPPVDLLSALFGVGGTLAFEILTAYDNKGVARLSRLKENNKACPTNQDCIM